MQKEGISMKMREYIDRFYPIREKVEQKIKDPVQRVLEEDDLPCDEVLPVNGALQKVVYINTSEYVPVIELLSYSKQDIEKLPVGDDFRSTWEVYMENVDVQIVTIQELISASQDYMQLQKRRKEMVDRCTS